MDKQRATSKAIELTNTIIQAGKFTPLMSKEGANYLADFIEKLAERIAEIKGT